MIELIRRNFWWPKMDQQIIDYVRSCPECQKDKVAHYKPYGLLSPLELPYAPWTSIAMDFITDLPLSEDCDQLWVTVDRFTKMAHFIPWHKIQKKAEHLVKIFSRDIRRFHGIPTDIITATATPPLHLQQPAPKPSIIPSDSDSQHSFTYLCEFPESAT
jgi:hypothetical protein